MGSKMLLKELKEEIDFYISNGHENDAVVITTADPSVGARGSSGVSSIYPGFDHETGQIRIDPVKKLISYEKDRDKPIEPWREEYAYPNGRKREILNCRRCGSLVKKDDRYCSCCGQRLV